MTPYRNKNVTSKKLNWYNNNNAIINAPVTWLVN